MCAWIGTSTIPKTGYTSTTREEQRTSKARNSGQSSETRSLPNPLTYYANVNWTHTFSPSIVNEAAVGFTRFRAASNVPIVRCRPSAQEAGLQEGFGNGFSPALFIQNDWNWRDVLSVNRGNHSLKAGVEIFRDQENDQFSGPQQRPNYDFRNLFDFAADTPVVENNVNYDLRDGTPSFQDVQYRVTTFGFFVQDNWKVKKNFSLNLGLRWDFSSNPNEKNGRIATSYWVPARPFSSRLPTLRWDRPGTVRDTSQRLFRAALQFRMDAVSL